ncbi:MAG: sugar 3,4-ketoisomerase [Thermoleophilaceae bacterium]
MGTTERLAECRLIDLTTAHDARGALTWLADDTDLPFAVRRVFWLYDVPAGAARAEHANRCTDQLLICLHGGSEVVLDDGGARRRVTLDRPDRGLVLPRMIWHELRGFGPGTVCLVLASELYDAHDYCRSYAEFLRLTR